MTPAATRRRGRVPSPGPIEVVARGRAAAPHAARARRLLGALRTALRRRRAGVTLLLADDRRIRTLNRRFRGADRPTDVLAFPAGTDLEPGRPHLGEIAISVPRAALQARRAGWPLRSEVALLVTHGFLHLLGYDHETDDGTMRRLETRLLRRVAGVALTRRRVPWGEAAPGGRARDRRRRTRHDH